MSHTKAPKDRCLIYETNYVNSLIDEVAKIKQQRDELLAAMCMASGHVDTPESVKSLLQNAITKATGVQSWTK